MSTARPLLTIAIPTYNRATDLAALLAMLAPQAAAFPQVEVLVSDNASPDVTLAVTAAAQAAFAAAGTSLTVHRHAENIGSDANFVSCFERASGHFFWLCGDDDLILPGSLALIMSHLQSANGQPADVDLVYATSYPFREDWERERQNDPFGRRFHTIRNAREFSQVVNIMFTFISGIIVNKARLEAQPHEAPSAFLGTNLVQLSWSLPLLLTFRQGIVVWQRPLAGKLGNAHGYSLGSVFGEQLAAVLARLLPGRRDLQTPILHTALRRWFPFAILDARRAGNTTLGLDEAHETLQRVFGRNPRYWLFAWPALAWPLPLASLYTRATAALSKLIYIAHLPGFWRKETH